MADLKRDPVVNVVQNGIKKGIRTTLENECYAAAVILIYSGIDTMAFLNMSTGQEDVTREDFVQWVERYIAFPCKHQLTGLDVYGARCGMLHSYSVTSRLSREGRCRRIGYMDRSVPAIRYDPAIATDFVLVSVDALADVFFNAIDRFLVDLFADPVKAAIAEERFQTLVYTLPYEPPSKA